MDLSQGVFSTFLGLAMIPSGGEYSQEAYTMLRSSKYL